MKKKFKIAHMISCFVYAALSYCQRKKVGALVVKKGKIISMGYNGTPAGWDNTCEVETDNGLATKDEVSHAEHNAIAKLAGSKESAKNSVIFCTTAPCINCSKLIADSGVKKVYYSEIYRSDEGLKYLSKRGIKTEQIVLEGNTQEWITQSLLKNLQ